MADITGKKKNLPGRASIHLLPGMRAAMEEAGFTRVSELWRAFKNAIEARQENLPLSYQRTLDLSNGEGCFDPDSGAYTPLAEMMADFLHAQPSELFGAMPDDPRVYDINPDHLPSEERIEGFTQPEDICMQREREHALKQCFDQLTLIDESGTRVLRLRYGLDNDGPPLEREEVARIMHISVPRVRDLELRAMARLKYFILKSYARPVNLNDWSPHYNLDI